MTEQEASDYVDQQLNLIAQEKYGFLYAQLSAGQQQRCLMTACARYTDAQLSAGDDLRKQERERC